LREEEADKMQYYDSLGCLDYNATISVFYRSVGYWPEPCHEERHLVLSATSSAPKKQWDYPASIDAIIAEMDADGWDCVAAVDGRGLPVITCEHRETKAAALVARAAHDAKWASAKDVYIRFGDIPACGYSRDWASNRAEKGVSVFRGKILRSGEILPMPGTNQELGSLLTMDDRPLYVVEGDEVGAGADGEPVLANAKQYAPKAAAKRLF